MNRSKKLLMLLIFFFSSFILISQERFEIIEGIVELGRDNQVVLIKDPESRSRVSFYLLGELANEIKLLVGSSVIITGFVISDSDNRWTKKITVTSYHDFYLYDLTQMFRYYKN